MEIQATPRVRRILTLVLVILLAATGSARLYAVDNTGVFELDGDAMKDAVDDAENIFAGTTLGPALVTQFVTDPVNDTNDDIFQGGLSKDTRDITSWGWTNNSSNDKNDIGNVFLSLYEVDGDSILYFGLDVHAPNGDAALGFWFLQDDVEKVTGGGFSAGHMPGDVLVQIDVISGGNDAEVFTYTWGPNGLLNIPQTPPAQGLLTLAIQDTKCIDAPGDQSACANFNDTTVGTLGTIPSPWPYQAKGHPNADEFPAFTYFEAGLNLSDLFPEGIPCLRAFVAETRQSQSETAVLEDFVLGRFNLCDFTITKNGPPISKVGDTVTYDVVIENTGALPLTKVAISDNLAGSLTDQCDDELPPAGTCEISYQYTVQAGDPAELVNTVQATYDFGGAEVTEQSSHTLDLFTLGVSLDKTVNGGDGPVTILQGETVEYGIVVTNTSSANAPSLDCTVTDAMLGIDTSVSLVSGADHTITQTSGIFDTPTQPGQPIVNTASVSCSPADYPNTETASDSVAVNVSQAQVDLTITKTGDNYSKVGDAVSYTIGINSNSDYAITLTSIFDTVLGDLTDGSNSAITSFDCPVSPSALAADGSCSIALTRATAGDDPDPLVNIASVQGTDVFGNIDSAQDNHSVDLVAPDYTVDKSCLTREVQPGESANFDIRIENIGDVALVLDVTDTLLNIADTGIAFGVAGTDCLFGEPASDANDGCLLYEGGVVAQPGDDFIYNQAFASATLPQQFGLDNVIDRSDDARCNVTPPGGGDATRTLGFWKSHGSDAPGTEPIDPSEYDGYTCHVSTQHGSGLPIDLGWKSLENCADVYGVFWSSMAHESVNKRKKRGRLCKTQLHASWQLLAAILNTRLTNGQQIPLDVDGPNPTVSIITAMQDALNAGDAKEIKRLQSLLDGYNNSGDNVAIIDSDGMIIPHADPNGAREVADYSAGDCR